MSGPPPTIFRVNDVRGVVGADLSPDVARRIGWALADPAAGRPCTVLMGQDCRPSSDSLAAAVCAGASMRGADVVAVREGPTPMLDFVVREVLACGGPGRRVVGVMVTGSHNPAGWNGLKITVDGRPLHGAGLQDLARAIGDGGAGAGPPGPTKVVDVHAQDRWIRSIVASFAGRGGRSLRVAVDGGNGVAGEAACAVCTDLGHDVIPLFCIPDGSFPNHHPDPADPANMADLQAAVLRAEADVGIAFDGDGDRLGVVDGEGAAIPMDRVAALLARDVLTMAPAATILGDVKCSDVFFDAVRRMGGRAVMTATGHSLVKEAMATTGAAFAAELSGHLYFADLWNGTDDAVYAGARLLSMLAQPGSRPLAAMLADLPGSWATPEIRVDADDEAKHRIVRRVDALARARGLDVCDIDGVRVRVDGGWWLVRASNTQPALVLRAEGRTPEGMDAALAEARSILDAAGTDLSRCAMGSPAA